MLSASLAISREIFELSSCCWIVAEKTRSCIDENVSVSLAIAGVTNPKKTIARNNLATVSDSVGRRANTGLLEPYPFLNRGVTADEGGGGGECVDLGAEASLKDIELFVDRHLVKLALGNLLFQKDKFAPESEVRS